MEKHYKVTLTRNGKEEVHDMVQNYGFPAEARFFWIEFAPSLSKEKPGNYTKNSIWIPISEITAITADEITTFATDKDREKFETAIS